MNLHKNQEPRTWTFCPVCFRKGDKIEGKILTKLAGRSLFDLRFRDVAAPIDLEFECPECGHKWKE